MKDAWIRLALAAVATGNFVLAAKFPEGGTIDDHIKYAVGTAIAFLGGLVSPSMVNAAAAKVGIGKAPGAPSSGQGGYARVGLILVLLLVAGVALAGVASAGCCEQSKPEKPCNCEPLEWDVYAETLLNSDSNVEATLGAHVGQWMIDLRAREAEYGELGGTKWSPAIVGDDELEYELRTGLVFWQGDRVSHGPVVNYTKRAGGYDTWAGGWRVQIGSH